MRQYQTCHITLLKSTLQGDNRQNVNELGILAMGSLTTLKITDINGKYRIFVTFCRRSKLALANSLKDISSFQK